MARTKQTGPRKARLSLKPAAKRTPKPAPPPPSPALRSPAQPTELLPQDRERVRDWLDSSKKQWNITVAPMSKKRKRGPPVQTQTDIFADRLSLHFDVKPRDKWECLRRYKKFTVGNESLETGQCVLVKHDEKDEMGIDVLSQWKAKVLEVRALDPEHVYVRVTWLNRPEDLKEGRKPHHGKFELVPTNEMDIIDAMSVNGPCNVVQWDETDDDSAMLQEDQFFWRQTYDAVGSKTFSKLRTICTCETPINPDEMIIQCPHEHCRGWQHIKCIGEDALKPSAEHDIITAKKPTKRKSNAKKPSLPPTPAAAPSITSIAPARSTNHLGETSEVMIAGVAGIRGQPPAKKSEIVFTGVDGERTSRVVGCLFCGGAIE